MNWSDLAANPLGVGTFIAFVLYVVWTERKAILGFLGRRQELAERGVRTEQDFEAQARDRLLQNGDYSKTLVDRIMQMLETERAERRAISGQIVDHATAAQAVAAQAVSVMQDFADISRRQCDRLDNLTERIVTVLEKQERMQTATWFVLAKYGLSNPQADIVEMEHILNEEVA